MDTIDLKIYNRTYGFVDRKFYEFYINDKPLSSLITEFCNLDKSLLENWVGVLGSFQNRQSELNKIKRLLLKQISEQEILDIFPKGLDKYYLDHGIEDYKKELADQEIIIYGCAECGDYGCGGYAIKIDKQEELIIWTFNDEGNILQFHFDKHQYFNAFDNYRQLIDKRK